MEEGAPKQPQRVESAETIGEQILAIRQLEEKILEIENTLLSSAENLGNHIPEHQKNGLDATQAHELLIQYSNMEAKRHAMIVQYIAAMRRVHGA